MHEAMIKKDKELKAGLKPTEVPTAPEPVKKNGKLVFAMQQEES